VTTLRDESHVERMRQEFLLKKRNALSSAIKMMQKLGVGAPAELQRQLNDLGAEINEMKKNKISKMRRDEQITEYVDDSGSLSVQWSILCDVSHNNINSLAVRHLDIADGKENIVLYAPLDEQLAEVITATLSSLLVDVGLLIGEFVSSGNEEYLAGIQRAQSELHWVM